MTSPDSELSRLARSFLDLSLDPGSFSHEAHLRVGLWYVLQFSPTEALERLRKNIRAFNTAAGGVNSDTEGYHETLTRLYLILIADVVDQRGRGFPDDVLADRVVAALSDREIPAIYYSKERLFSVAARRAWLEPDLRRLPKVARSFEEADTARRIRVHDHA